MTKLSTLSILVSLCAVTLSTNVCCEEDIIQKQQDKIFSLKYWQDFSNVETCNPYPECELWPDKIYENDSRIVTRAAYSKVSTDHPKRKVSTKSSKAK